MRCGAARNVRALWREAPSLSERAHVVHDVVLPWRRAVTRYVLLLSQNNEVS